MARRRNPLAQWAVTAACVVFAKATRLCPLTLSRAVGRACAFLIYHLAPRVRRVGMANLDLAYGDSLTEAEKRRILKGAVANMGIVAAEFSHTPEIGAGGLPALVAFEGLDNVDPEKGALIIGAHMGNWEWMAPAVAAQGFKVAEVVRPLDHPPLNAVIDGIRTSSNILTIPKDQAGGEVIRLAREGYLVGILVDQSPRRNGVPVRFFGQDTWGTIGPAMAAMRARVPVHPVAMTRCRNGSYVLRMGSPLTIERSGNMRADLLKNSQTCQDAIEELVRAYPEQWLWLHRRWKPRPGLEQRWNAGAKRQAGEGGAEDSAGQGD